MGFILGMDGGGTSTQGVILQQGKECARIAAGGINYNSYSQKQIREHLQEIAEKCREYGFAPALCTGVGIGAAGISNPAAVSFLKECIKELGFVCPVVVMGDHEAALRGGLMGEAGLLLIAGTGSVCLAQDKAGKLYRTGGYGHLIDDGGSAYAIGRDILQAVVRSHDGREEKTVLTEAVFQTLGIHSVGELIGFVYNGGTGKREIAYLAQLLTEERIKSDLVSEKIAKAAASELVELIGPCLSRMEEGFYPILFSGSVLVKNKKIGGFLREQIAREKLPVYVAERKKDPAIGAASWFQDNAG
ncbi:N-acetylglucosamine kinase [Parablautia muri]|uniref:ATPase n=1 Tax=Parablautia muri TaxID=2320879 RepID=A0A9X5BD53_9FIRM|nr:BadF/BadG/BcrA/BcrD ATPase family protein [Parablautia muri]NBJ91563.1 ATPase [Parablautia muri]